MVNAILECNPQRLSLQETRNHVKTVLELYYAAKQARELFHHRNDMQVIIINNS